MNSPKDTGPREFDSPILDHIWRVEHARQGEDALRRHVRVLEERVASKQLWGFAFLVGVAALETYRAKVRAEAKLKNGEPPTAGGTPRG